LKSDNKKLTKETNKRSPCVYLKLMQQHESVQCLVQKFVTRYVFKDERQSRRTLNCCEMETKAIEVMNQQYGMTLFWDITHHYLIVLVVIDKLNKLHVLIGWFISSSARCHDLCMLFPFWAIQMIWLMVKLSYFITMLKLCTEMN
jgi:hypothetical protein